MFKIPKMPNKRFLETNKRFEERLMYARSTIITIKANYDCRKSLRKEAEKLANQIKMEMPKCLEVPSSLDFSCGTIENIIEQNLKQWCKYEEQLKIMRKKIKEKIIESAIFEMLHEKKIIVITTSSFKITENKKERFFFLNGLRFTQEV